ncbi:MAG: signal transduction histidine kinase [Candidatus Latescibacterota bacterium]|jgi:signal transduction histidine kinase
MTSILIVEDESIVGLDIQKRLLRMGHSVSAVVASGEAAIESVHKDPPDLALMDIHIQGEMDGVETAAHIRSQMDIPIVFLTAYSDENTLQRAKATEPYAYVLKPFKDRELSTTIEIALYRHSIEKKLQQAHDHLELRVQERTAELASVNEELKGEIEERKRADEANTLLEEQLRQSQKMEALGQLAGGVAHDFNNMLTIITGYSELVLGYVNEKEPLYSDLKAIKEAGDRAAVLTSQLLTFGRRQALEYTILNLNTAVDTAHGMLQRMIGEDISFEIDLHPATLFVRTDPGQFDQALVNLVVNARDAMPRGGKLHIKTRNISLEQPLTNRFIRLIPGQYALLRIVDTGKGMDTSILGRIFEPFFTTKSKGKGTGLGLAMVYSIVNQSGGQIDVSSAPGTGTIFDIYLPLSKIAPKNEPEKKTQQRKELKPISGTILLVEDEEVVRNLAHRVLRDHGFDVLEARKGEEALVLAELHDGTIDLLLTDVVMPEMSGYELAQHLGPQRPDMRILYMSGYTNDDVLRYGIHQGHVPFLQKPFGPDDLVAKVHQVLSVS